MAEEALARCVEEQRLLQKLADCYEKYKKAALERKRQEKKVNPDKVLKEHLESKLSRCLHSSDPTCCSCLRFHFDAYGFKKDEIMDSYKNDVGKLSFEELKVDGALPEIRREDLLMLPAGSFALRLEFCLRKPYYSKDDVEFYVIDNPLKKERVLKAPFIAPSQWKGALYSVMTHQLAKWWTSLGDQREEEKNEKKFLDRRLSLVRLFGNEQGVEVDTNGLENYLDSVGGERLAASYRERLKKVAPTGSRRGRLIFYPTVFSGIDLEVINPHSRETGAGSQPIYLEVVPKGSCGRFSVLYVPFDGMERDTCEGWKGVLRDLLLVAEGVSYLLPEFGFGAKTSSGFGLADPELPSKGGEVLLRLPIDRKIKGKKFRTLNREDDEGLVSAAKRLVAACSEVVGGDAHGKGFK